MPMYTDSLEWTDCKERLPSPNEDVLVWSGRYMGFGYMEPFEHVDVHVDPTGRPYDHAQVLWHAEPGDCLNPSCGGWPQITHWRPLPFPPGFTETRETPKI